MMKEVSPSQNLFQRNTGAFFDSFESLEGPEKENLLKSRLSSLIEYSKTQIPFYEDRLRNFDESSNHPLHSVPVLYASDLRENLPPKNRNLISKKPHSINVFQSGGTTGEAKTTLFSFSEMEQINFLNARGFYACGLKESDLVANFWAVGGLYMTFVHMNRMLMEYGCTNFPFSNHTPAEFSYNVVKQFGINCFTGIASVVLNNLRQMHEMAESEAVSLNIDKIYYGGEHFYEADRKELKEKFGTEKILAPGYGTVDTWYIGYQCEQTPPGYFHTHEDQCYTEILDNDSLAPIDDGRIGLLHATPLLRQLTPIIRYSVGDRARWIGEDCPCGRKTKVFELLGRGDDVLRIGYDSIDYNAVQEIVLKVDGLSGTLQMRKNRREGRDELVLRIESDLEKSNSKSVIESKETEVNELFLKERPSFSEFVKKGSIWPLKVEVVPMNSLERNPRTGKLQRVKDAL